jgi:hypothetical protein
MANRRGDVSLEIDGERYTLRLTLGALAELEEAFAVDDLPALGARFASGKLSSRDLLRLLAAALRGGGHPLSDAQVAALPIDGVAPVAEALTDLLAAAFGDGENPPGPQGA